MSKKRNFSIKAMMIGLALALVAVVAFTAAACTSPSAASNTSGPSGRIRPVLLSPVAQGDTVSVPLSQVQVAWNTRFNANTAAGAETFMVYNYNGQTYVRASICVPCGGRSYSLQGNALICDTCGTVFDAATGKGRSGVPACQSYPKAAVPFQTINGNIVMKNADLLAAFQKTLNP